jgi:2-polyprenyl-6-methoxyphenol hydroxylase-like FAD-dependent oxidoreductase
MSAAIGFRQHDVEVDVVDSDPAWRVYGAGITITGPTFRAFERLGILDAVREIGFFSQKVKFYGAMGEFRGEMDRPVLEPGIPAAGGILRPTLHRILSSRVKDTGCNVRLGLTVNALEDVGHGVTVAFSDGATDTYDVVIGADGTLSKVRTLLFPDGPSPVFTGQGCWRALAPRPKDLDGTEIYFGPNNVKVGVNPCAPDWLYLFATLSMPGNPFVPADELTDRMRNILAPFGGRIAEVRDGLGPQSSVNYRPLSALLLPLPWHRGRIGLIGDAIHSTTPHLASGAGIAVEDALVLVLELMRAENVTSGWQSFETRRWERCRMVVENSLLISRLEQEGGHDADVARLMGESAHSLAQPI